MFLEVGTILNTRLNKEIKERILLIGLCLTGEDRIKAFNSLNELDMLCKTTQAIVVDKILQTRQNSDPRYFLGKGKVEELQGIVGEKQIDSLLFDNELSPTQVRNIQNLLGVKVLTRTDLILDIFASRAKTNDAKLQVELAQLMHTLPRLTRLWVHLSRIKGGIGFRGPGEKQLEIDRRLIKQRIHKIKTAVSKLDTQLENRRKNRRGFKQFALVGYTNAGKSTLLNTLCRENVYVKNQFFATLDSTIRKVYLDETTNGLLLDTVGFINKLPHTLIASFKSTLSEIKESDVLLHVISAEDEDIPLKIKSVENVLQELNVLNKPTIYVINKWDLILEDNQRQQLIEQYPNAIFVSAKDKVGIDILKQRMLEILSTNKETVKEPQNH